MTICFNSRQRLSNIRHDRVCGLVTQDLAFFSPVFHLLINVKMSTIVGTLTFMSREIAFLVSLRLKNAEFLNIFSILRSI